MVTTPWHVEIRVDGAAIDPCRVRLPLEITHGRSGIGAQPDPPSCSFVWESPTCLWQVGDALEVWSGTQYTPATYDDPTTVYDDPTAVYDSDGTGVVYGPRFVGTIAGLRAVSELGAVQSWAVEGVGGLARLGFLPVNLTRPQETDVARVQAVCAAAGVAVRISGNAGVQLAAGPVTGDALSALHDVAESTGGLVWQSVDGTIVYGTADHRLILSTPVGVIPCEAMESSLDWEEAVESIVNEVTISWGTADARGQSTHRDNESVAMPWGVRAVDVSTLCATEADAEQLGLLILARRASPYWEQVAAVLAVDDIDPDDSRLFAALDVSSPVLTPIPVTPGPNPLDVPVPVILEGWVETWTAGFEHIAQAAFSDQKRWVTTSLRTYAGVRDGGTYADWLANGDYLALLVEGG